MVQPTSFLPQPRRTSPRKLAESAAAANNARPASMLPPPPGQLKRKTLAERAGEVNRPGPAPAPASHRMGFQSHAKSVSSSAASRQTSLASSTSSRPSSSASVYSHGSTMYTGGLGQPRVPASQSYRPHSSISSHSAGRIPGAGHRPAPSVDSASRAPSNASMQAPADNWHMQDRFDKMESMYAELRSALDDTRAENDGRKETLALYKARIHELEDLKIQSTALAGERQRDIDTLRQELASSKAAFDDAKRAQKAAVLEAQSKVAEAQRQHVHEQDDVERKHRRELEQVQHDLERELRQMHQQHQDEAEQQRRRHASTLEEEQNQRRREMQEMSTEGAEARIRSEVEMKAKEDAIARLESQRRQDAADLERERDTIKSLKTQLADTATAAVATESAMRSLRARVEFLESDSMSQSRAFADLEQQTQNAIRQAQEATEKLRTEETLRRKLHNQVQELKGNIRVFCRVRPILDDEVVAQAQLSYPDSALDAKEVDVLGPEEKSSLGTVTTKNHAFSFDRVFAPGSQNAAVFEEISQLVQSALDGYNVCIFCYGQTGSGKTFTMSSADGMIPRAVRQIYESAAALTEKGWSYTMEGSFVEVYNESVHDLLGRPEDLDRQKIEIRHDTARQRTRLVDATIEPLDAPDSVDALLKRAQRNRSVAATKANERSSRSHAVFILRLVGVNAQTGERSEGTLNLVDLAGSERLSHSGATGERLRETQSINKSLSCLGDVIAALGQGKEGGHVPYRNSKLTHLLQYSLGGNSKTLMFVMVSPLQAHLSETLTSLRFATKVHNTHIGTARRQAKVRD